MNDWDLEDALELCSAQEAYLAADAEYQRELLLADLALSEVDFDEEEAA